MLMLSDLIKVLQAHEAVHGPDVLVLVQTPIRRETVAAAARRGIAIAVPGVDVSVFMDANYDKVLVVAASREFRLEADDQAVGAGEPQ